MASCGISLNLSSLESKITAHFGAIKGIAGLAGLPFVTTGLLVGLALSRGNFLAAFQIIVPQVSLDGLWKGMRTEFAKAFALPGVPGNIAELQQNLANATAAVGTTPGTFGGIGVTGSADFVTENSSIFSSLGVDTFLGKLGDIGETFVDDAAAFAKKSGLDQLSGYVDINVTDLAKTAIGLGGSFDECDFGTSGIQNYFKDPATGTIKLLANYAPKLGDTSVAAGNNVLGLSAAINSIFQTGKTSVQLQLNAILGDVVSSGTNYVLDKITGSTKIDSRDVSNVKQYISDYISPSAVQSVRTDFEGFSFLDSEIRRNSDLDVKLVVNGTKIFGASEYSFGLGFTVSF